MGLSRLYGNLRAEMRIGFFFSDGTVLFKSLYKGAG